MNAARRSAPSQCRHRHGGGAATLGCADQRERRRGEPRCREQRPRDVEPAGCRRVARLRHMPVRHEDHEGANRQVDQEDPAPGHRIDEVAAEERPDRSGDSAQPRPRTDRAGPVLGVERRLDDGEASRREEGAADALKDARGDQDLGAGRQRAQGRGEREPDDPHVEDQPPAHPVAERAAEEDERRERQQVAVEDPLEVARRRAQVTPDLGHRDVHDGGLEERDPRAEDRDRQDPPPLRRPEAD